MATDDRVHPPLPRSLMILSAGSPITISVSTLAPPKWPACDLCAKRNLMAKTLACLTLRHLDTLEVAQFIAREMILADRDPQRVPFMLFSSCAATSIVPARPSHRLRP